MCRDLLVSVELKVQTDHGDSKNTITNNLLMKIKQNKTKLMGQQTYIHAGGHGGKTEHEA